MTGDGLRDAPDTPEAPLLSRLRRLIAAQGPISVADYMALCLGDPEHGYYLHAEPFGASGDFITAPEVSQLFGEIVGAWLLHAWQRLGAPDRVHLTELGPGRGTLAADTMRVARLRPAFADAITLHLVETSPRLREAQRAALAPLGVTPIWHDTQDTLPDDAPLLAVANEFFDALPIRQYVRHEGVWRERCVGLDAAGSLRFQLGAGTLATNDLPAALCASGDGTILEVQPTANAIMTALAERLAAQGGAALVIDYGYAATAPGDTLQAVAAHAYAPVLAEPGRADLTAHVNFEVLARAACRPGLSPRRLMTQGDFLLDLGLLERAGQLGAGKAPEIQERIRQDVERLAGPDQMGTLFKVLALAPPDIALAPFDPV